MITQRMFREIKNPKHPLHYLLPPVKVPNGSAAYISISTSTLQNYTLWKGFGTILHFQEILVVMLNL